MWFILDAKRKASDEIYLLFLTCIFPAKYWRVRAANLADGDGVRVAVPGAVREVWRREGTYIEVKADLADVTGALSHNILAPARSGVTFKKKSSCARIYRVLFPVDSTNFYCLSIQCVSLDSPQLRYMYVSRKKATYRETTVFFCLKKTLSISSLTKHKTGGIQRDALYVYFTSCDC